MKLSEQDKTLLKAALYYAIEWEKSFYASIRGTSDEVTKKKTIANIKKLKAFRERLFEQKKPITDEENSS